MDEQVQVVKRGETCATVLLRIVAGGLTVTIFSHPSIEEFFRNTCADKVDVRGLGRYWQFPGDRGEDGKINHNNVKPMPAYTSQKGDIEPIVLDSGDLCVFNRLGQPLMDMGADPISGRPRHHINLSFLKLVGISEGGITFQVRGVFTTDAVSTMKEKIGEGIRKFYRVYLKPVEMSIVVSTSEVQLPLTTKESTSIS